MRPFSLLVIVAVVLGALAPVFDARAADKTRKQDEQAIRAAAAAYIEALARQDAKALAQLWMPEGEIVDEFGRATPAGELIALETKVDSAANPSPRPRVKVSDSSIRFLTADVAVEDGRVEVAAGPTEPAPPAGRFTAIWVKHDGRWRLASLREMRAKIDAPEELARLGWMVGDWTGRLGTASVDLSTRWNHKHTYLERDLTVTHDGRTILSGRQRIGIDPLDGKIKSWMHDDDGGHGEGIWTRQGDAWIVQAVGVTPEGKQTTGTNVYRREGQDKMVWKSTGAFADGQPLPDFEVTLSRAANEK